MIIEMTRLRLIGRRADLDRTMAALQDAGTLHLIEPASLPPRAVPAAERRRRHHLERALADVDAALAALSELGARDVTPAADGAPAACAARHASRLRARIERLVARQRALADERAALRAWAPMFAEFEQLAGEDRRGRRFSAFLLRLRGSRVGLEALRAVLDRRLDGAYELRAHALSDGELALLLLAPAERADEVDRLLAGELVEPAPRPALLDAGPLIDALPRMRPRLAEVERALADGVREAAALARSDGHRLVRARRDLRDELIGLDARAVAAETAHAFVIEGWVPARALAALRARVRRELGDDISIEAVARHAWHGDQAPVVLSNPPVFAPFERLTSMLPLPRYGSVDPTPFVAVFFPMLFGIIVGDVGYGILMGLIALALWRRRGLARDVSRIAAAVASFTIIFGVLYGELFGDLGTRFLGMRPVWLDRAEAVVPFLALAVSLGLVHLVLGLVIAAIDRRRRPREAAGRGLSALMLILVATALAAVFEVLPGALFTPAIVALLIAFPVLVVLEGFTAVLELVTMAGHVLSYARVMALGTASVMLAVVANRMVGAFGGVAIGVMFALLFHLVNFAITVFSPTIHVLRLHYVEFFGTFFAPGGGTYRPFAHATATQE